MGQVYFFQTIIFVNYSKFYIRSNLQTFWPRKSKINPLSSWTIYRKSSLKPGDASQAALVDASQAALVDASQAALVDASQAALVDASQAALVDASQAALDASQAALVDASI